MASTTTEVLLQPPAPETLPGATSPSAAATATSAGDTNTGTTAPPKRQRRPSVRLGEIGTASYDRLSKHPFGFPPPSKTRPLTNLANGDGFFGRRAKPRRGPTKRSRSNWASSRPDSDSPPPKDYIPDLWHRREPELESLPDRKEGVRSWLVELGLSRYAPVFEVHEVDEEVLPMLTLEDLRDMGINAVGSRRKLYSAIQKLANAFS